MPGHNKGFCCMVLPRDLFSLSLCYLVIGSLENAEVQPETSESHGFIVLHMFRPITMHFCRHIFNGGKKHMYSSTPYDWCISFFFFFLFLICHHAMFPPSGVFRWTFPLPFSIQSPLIEISQNQTQKWGEKVIVSSSSTLFFSCLFFSLKGRGWL